MKIKFKKIFSIASISLFTIPLAACGVNEANLYQQDYNVANETYTSQVMNKTLSLKFVYYTNSNTYTTVKGTGWIWEVSGNDYYIATNMHVAGASTFSNSSFWMPVSYSENKTRFILTTVLSYSSELGFYNGSNVVDSSYVKVSNPTVVYTTINDENYNKAINPSNENSYVSNVGGSSNKYWGISDICILKYTINKEEVSKNNTSSEYNAFYNWLTAYNSNPTIIYGSDSQSASALNLSKYVYYSGGFPKSSDSTSKASVDWKPVSDFKLNSELTKQFGNGWNNDMTNINPITFIDSTFSKGTSSSADKNENLKVSNLNSSSLDLSSDDDSTKPTITSYSDKTKTNFLNAGYTGYFYGHSDEGASGSLLATNINGKFQVVGIYWGISTFLINGIERKLGCYDIFVTSKYNIAYSIEQAIKNDISSTSSS